MTYLQNKRMMPRPFPRQKNTILCIDIMTSHLHLAYLLLQFIKKYYSFIIHLLYRVFVFVFYIQGQTTCYTQGQDKHFWTRSVPTGLYLAKKQKKNITKYQSDDQFSRRIICYTAGVCTVQNVTYTSMCTDASIIIVGHFREQNHYYLPIRYYIKIAWKTMFSSLLETFTCVLQ